MGLRGDLGPSAAQGADLRAWCPDHESIILYKYAAEGIHTHTNNLKISPSHTQVNHTIFQNVLPVHCHPYHCILLVVP